MEINAIQIPSYFYYIVGFLILTNLGSVFTMITFAIKGTWHLSKADSRIDDAKDTAIRAHKRIDKIEGNRVT